MGNAGWIYLSHEEGQAKTSWIDSKGTLTNIPVFLDERICFDTLFRAIRLSPNVFSLGDILLLNGNPIYGRLNYEQRKDRIATLLEFFHSTDLTAFFPPDVFPAGTLFHGTEYYDSLPGSQGVFVSASV